MKPPCAFSCAIELWRMPMLAPAIRRQPLPPDVLELIKLAAGSSRALALAREWADWPAQRWRDVACFYLQEIVLHQQADAYRLLGANPDATLNRLGEHRRWMLKWLHPDRNAEKWVQAGFVRVQDAWCQLTRDVSPPLPVTVGPRVARGRERSLRWVRVPLPQQRQRSVGRTVARGVGRGLLRLTLVAAALLAMMHEASIHEGSVRVGQPGAPGKMGARLEPHADLPHAGTGVRLELKKQPQQGPHIDGDARLPDARVSGVEAQGGGRSSVAAQNSDRSLADEPGRTKGIDRSGAPRFSARQNAETSRVQSSTATFSTVMPSNAKPDSKSDSKSDSEPDASHRDRDPLQAASTRFRSGGMGVDSKPVAGRHHVVADPASPGSALP